MEDIVKLFPMPEFRSKQKEILVKCYEAFESGVRLILLDAPVGFGKSAVNTTLCRYYTPSVYTTPQLSLIDQIKSDKYLSKFFTEIKGRDNYMCPKDMYLTTVRYGKCRRVKDHGCNMFRECPYYSQKIKAINSLMTLMSTAYYIVDAYLEPPNFSSRNLVVIDEGHMLAEHVASQVSFQVTRNSMPKVIYERYKDILTGEPSIDLLIMMYRDMAEFSRHMQSKLDGEGLSDEETVEKLKAEEWMERCDRYVKTMKLADWVWSRRHDGWAAMPVYPKYLMSEMIWSRGYRFIVSSATILDPDFWADENGAKMYFKPDEIVYIRTGMSFPPENRRVVDVSVGSMSYRDQTDNLESAIEIIRYIIGMHRNENIAIHVPSYELAEKIYRSLGGEDRKIIMPSPEDRDVKLTEWKNNGGVFLAVAYWEGQDWKYDVCTVQILAKTLYPDVSDARVKRRLKAKDYKWLMWTALMKCLQAYGRAIRAEDDKMVFYVLDTKFWELVRRMWKHVPQWFREVIPENRLPKTARKHGKV
ncbi:MAG: helicase C-terminal domain-containing protein [Ignisphaera sp.]|nr:helicase C-terminal domain-containing protein [Ignisphaera sp.]